MENNFTLSQQSKSFIENLRLYLFSSGKSSDEIEEIIWELESHLYEAEKNGKPIEKVVGNSPEDYMRKISNEMEIDYRTWIKYVFLIIIGAFSISIVGDILNGSLSYSVLEIIGFIVIALVYIFSLLKVFKYLAITKDNTGKQIGILLPIVLLPVILFVGLNFLNNAVSTPTIHFDKVSTLIIGILIGLFIIGISLWAKTLILIVVVVFTTLPGYVLNQTSLSVETSLILGVVIMFGGIGTYLAIVNFLDKKKQNLRNNG